MKANKIYNKLNRDVLKLIQHCEKLVRQGDCKRSASGGTTRYTFPDTSDIRITPCGVRVRGSI